MRIPMTEQDTITIERYVKNLGSKMSLSQMSRKLGIPLRFLQVGDPFVEEAPIVPQAPINLLAALSWQAGAQTTVSTSGGRARVTSLASDTNPRIFKGPFSTQAGKTYRYQGTVYPGTSINNLFVRVSADATVQNDGPAQAISFVITPTVIDGTWTAVTNISLYLGLVAIVDAIGEYAEISDDFSIIEV